MIRYFALASLVFVASGAYPQEQPVAVQKATEEKPWGYVYVFRSLRAYPLTGEDGVSFFPFRTFAMLASLGTIALVSLLTRRATPAGS